MLEKSEIRGDRVQPLEQQKLELEELQKRLSEDPDNTELQKQISDKELLISLLEQHTLFVEGGLRSLIGQMIDLDNEMARNEILFCFLLSFSLFAGLSGKTELFWGIILIVTFGMFLYSFFELKKQKEKHQKRNISTFIVLIVSLFFLVMSGVQFI